MGFNSGFKGLRCESCVKIFSHWPTAVLNTVVFGDLLQLRKNQVIYEYLKVDFSLPCSLCVFGDWQKKGYIYMQDTVWIALWDDCELHLFYALDVFKKK